MRLKSVIPLILNATLLTGFMPLYIITTAALLTKHQLDREKYLQDFPKVSG